MGFFKDTTEIINGKPVWQHLDEDISECCKTNNMTCCNNNKIYYTSCKFCEYFLHRKL